MLPDLATPGLEGREREPPACWSCWSLSAEQREKMLEREPERTLAASRLSIPSSQEVLESRPGLNQQSRISLCLFLSFKW